MTEAERNSIQSDSIVARASRTVVVIALMFGIPATIALAISPSLWRVAIVGIHLMIAYRVSQIRLTVSTDGVLVRNFFSDTFIPLWEVDVEIEQAEGGGALLSDAGGKFDQEGRILYINRPWNNDRVHVGVAPRFGSEIDRIYEELTAAIRLRRAA